VGDSASGGGGSSGSKTTSDVATSTGDCGFNCGTTSTGLGAGLTVTPPSAMLTITNGMIMTQAFTAFLDGTDVTSQVAWSFDRPEVGQFPTSGTFTPTGTAGGQGTVTVSLNGKSATASVVVKIAKVVNTANLTPADQAAFDTPSGADPSMTVVYPYNETVFPLDVLAPDVQYNGAAGGDVFRMKIDEKYYSYTEYFNDVQHHLIAQPDWDGMEQSGTGSKTDPVAFELARKSGATVYQGVANTWHIALGRLKGSVYYWELPDVCGSGNGRILRIKPSSTAVDQFFDPGTCWGCHTVSRDGGKMMGALSNGSPFPQITVDLTQNPATYGAINSGNYKTGGTFSAFNDKGDKILVSNDGTGTNERLRIIDATSGNTLNDNAMGNDCGEPAWSPDGTKIAAICGMNSGFGWMFDSSTGYLATADVAADGVTVSNLMTLVGQGGQQGRPAYPSFSPGSKYIAYGRPTAGSRSTGNGNLWLVGTDGSNNILLNNASNDNRSFNPVFAPLRAGGYYWLVFISRRDYGNQLVGANRQQLWITAVDDPPQPGVDPSHPPFYVRGQENCGKSENAYYALDPCKALGADCTSGVDCCNGQCVKDPQSGNFVCGTPNPGMCSEDGNACVTTADCCNPMSTCVDGFCEPPVPM